MAQRRPVKSERKKRVFSAKRQVFQTKNALKGDTMSQNLTQNMPALTQQSSDLLTALTGSLGLPREILASDKDIAQVFAALPDMLSSLPAEKRNEGIARLCVACSVGLFDSAINYIWNETIKILRSKLRQFGLSIIAQILGKNFSEKELNSMMDSQLLNLCLELNLISEEGFLFLDQCRDIRNNFSAAHPALGTISPFEFLNFFDRCVRHAYASTNSRRGVEIAHLLNSLTAVPLTEEMCSYWTSAISNTYDQQKSVILEMLHGIYCDGKEPSTKRNNCLALAKNIINYIPEDGKARILENHSKYLIAQNSEKSNASRWFFEKVNLFNLLSESEKHGMIMSICKSLCDVHLAIDNFYNEPPFAKRLQEIASSARPELSQATFVEVVTTCGIGNGYGVSFNAAPYYENIVKTFSPREIDIFFNLVKTQGNRINTRVNKFSSCRERFKYLASLINENFIHPRSQQDYKYWTN